MIAEFYESQVFLTYFNVKSFMNFQQNLLTGKLGSTVYHDVALFKF